MRDRRPQMTDREIEYIDNLLAKLEPESCLEWGSGKSTVYFPTRHEHIKKWMAIEHKERWFVYVIGRMNKLNTVVHFKTQENYLNVGGKWDFILVDGILRNECLAKARELLKPNGIVLLHDSYRDEYDEGVALYDKKEVIFEGIGEGAGKHKGLTKLWI